MDFVIFGVGLGATLVLLGWLWRTVGPRLRHRGTNGSVLSGEEMVARISWQRFCRSGGALWVMGGFVLVLAAYVSLLLNLSDHTGAVVVVATFLGVLLTIILWLVAYLHRFGPIGLVPKRKPIAVSTTTGRRRRFFPGRRNQREPSPPPVQGPAVPAEIAASLESMPSVAPEPTDADHAPANQTAEEEHAPGEVESTSEATIAGAADRAAADTERAPTRSRSPRLVNAHDRARAGDKQPDAAEAQAPQERESAEAGGNGSPKSGRRTTPPPTDEAGANAAGPATPETIGSNGSGGETSAASPADVPPASPAPAPGDRPARKRASTVSRVGSEAFRASIARQEEHLARAAGGGPTASRAAPAHHVRTKSSLPDPPGIEGTDWVRGDGTRAVPAGFPIKGNARSRRYHPEGTPAYAATIAEFYFATPEAAEAAGYELPKWLRES